MQCLLRLVLRIRLESEAFAVGIGVDGVVLMRSTPPPFFAIVLAGLSDVAWRNQHPGIVVPRLLALFLGTVFVLVLSLFRFRFRSRLVIALLFEFVDFS